MQASAQFYVRQPDVEKGESEVEEHGAIYVSPGDDEDLRQSHEVEFKRGLTDRAQLIIEGFFEQPIGENLQFKEFEIGGQYELIKPQGDGFAFAFRTIYEAAKDAPDEILFGPLARYAVGRNSTTLNTFFVGQVGDDPTIDSLEFQYNWQFKHELSHRVAFGVEAFGEIEDLAHPGPFNDQPHRAGPVIYLNFGEEAEGTEVEKRESEESEPEQKSEAPELKMAGYPTPPPTSRSSWMPSSNSKVLRKREMALYHTAMIEDVYWQEISRKRYILPFPILVTALLTSLTALGADDQSFELSLKEHKFTPQELTIPADKRVKLTVKNLDATAAEFESHSFKAEKVVPAGGEVSLYIGPLKAGTYGFFDDFHEDETKGTLIAK